MEIVVNEHIINSILKNVSLTSGDSISELDSILKTEYRNIILIITKDLDLSKLENNSFLVRNRFMSKITSKNKKINLSAVIQDINLRTDFNSYGLFKDVKRGYENINQVYKQIINLTAINTKKYIFSYIEDEDINKLNTNMNKLSRKVKDALIILTSINNQEIVLINKKEEEHNYIVRKPVVSDFTELKKIVFPYQIESRLQRKDIFSANRTYTLEEFSSLCRKNNGTYALLYEENNEILGFIEAKIKNVGLHNRRLNSNYILVIEKIMVKKESRRQKIATILYKEIEKYAKKTRVERIETEVYSFDLETIKLLESLNLDVQRTVYEKKFK